VPTAEIEGRELHYTRAGAGEPLLLIQGMGGTHLSWGEPFLEPLRRDFDCIAPDNRGIGHSAPTDSPFTVAEMATDALGLLEALEIERAHVLGISMGGMIAQELALGHPERLRSLTPGSQMIDPADGTKLAEAMASGSRDAVFRASWELNLSPGFRADESRYAAFAEMAAAAPASRRIIELQLQAILGHDTNARLPELETPTLIGHGTEDRILPVANGRLIASLVPGSRLEILDGVGHMFWWEQPRRSAELLRQHALTGV
jgi:pimeloyl-ACP methyl ester carboxylesterase